VVRRYFTNGVSSKKGDGLRFFGTKKKGIEGIAWEGGKHDGTRDAKDGG